MHTHTVTQSSGFGQKLAPAEMFKKSNIGNRMEIRRNLGQQEHHTHANVKRS